MSEKGPSLKRIKNYYSFDIEGKNCRHICESDHFIKLYGDIVSVSPSRQYCLLFGNTTKQFTIWDVDANSIVSQYKFDDNWENGNICNIQNAFSGFSWNEKRQEILYRLQFLFLF